MSAAIDPVAGWSARHHGIEPSRIPMVTGWLRLVWPAGRALARRGVPADAVTLTGVALGGAGAAVAARRPLLAAALIVGSAWCDGVDGAVAIFSGWTTRHGAILDKAADRVSDAALAVTLWRCGAPAPLAIAAGASAIGVEAVREVQGGAARAKITVGERPTRVICAAVACVSSRVSPARSPAAASAVGLTLLSAIAVRQLRRVRGQAPAAAWNRAVPAQPRNAAS